MESSSLRHAQLCQLLICIEIDRICRNNGINYWLDSGTLLGAVRHKGFIPWDDDLDIGMKREDYNKFIRIVSEHLDEDFVLQTWENDVGYAWPFSKIFLADTLYIEKASSKSISRQGVYVDIFPYDNFPDVVDKKQGMFLLLYKVIMKAKCKYEPWYIGDKFNVKRFVAYIPIRFISIFFKRAYIIKEYNKWATKYNNKETKKMFSQGIERYGDWVFPHNVFSSFKDILFENRTFLAPTDYETYLKCAYGDYMQLPPENERQNRHGIVSIDFGKFTKEYLENVLKDVSD